MNSLNLGIVIHKESNKVKNHRPFIKVFLNPFLRIVGIEIATNYNKETNKIKGITLQRCRKRLEFNFMYDLGNNYKVIKERRLI